LIFHCHEDGEGSFRKTMEPVQAFFFCVGKKADAFRFRNCRTRGEVLKAFGDCF